MRQTPQKQHQINWIPPWSLATMVESGNGLSTFIYLLELYYRILRNSTKIS